MDRSERDGLQYICKEDPGFALFYREFLTNHSHPSPENRIAICGLRGAGQRVLADIPSTASGGNTPTELHDGQGKPTLDPDSHHYIFTEDINNSPVGAPAGAIGADGILYVHSRSHCALAPAEIRFLAALRHRFPDLGQRMMVIYHGDKNQGKRAAA